MVTAVLVWIVRRGGCRALVWWLQGSGVDSAAWWLRCSGCSVVSAVWIVRCGLCSEAGVHGAVRMVQCGWEALSPLQTCMHHVHALHLSLPSLSYSQVLFMITANKQDRIELKVMV